MKRKLWAYIGGIARTNKFKALAVGGMPDHIHALLSLPATLAIAKAVQLIKGGSSKWMKRSFTEPAICVAGVVWDFHDRNLSGQEDNSVHQRSGAPPR